MLSPDDRRLYTDALRPPVGYGFRDAVATTYSLDLETLLTIPLHLALFSAERPVEELLSDGVALLEALRRTADRVTVFAQASRLLVPARRHSLYPLLESTVVEAAPPAPDGSFHPKLWLLRFERPGSGGTRLRLLVLTRNLTKDRCWDLVLTLEGEPGGRPREENRDLARLLGRLPDLALRPPARERGEAVRDLADLALHTEWELPGDFLSVRFHTGGLDGRTGWLPDPSGRLVVLSPFVSSGALQALADSTRAPLALISRPEELQALPPRVLARFGEVKILAEQAELEDGEEVDGEPTPDVPLFGLHAKAYLAKRGWRTHVYVGSANATSPAILNGANVELMAELEGLESRVGAVEDLLGPDGFGALLTDFRPDEDIEEPDPEEERARQALERARRGLAGARLRLRFAESDDGWTAELVPEGPVELEGGGGASAWLATRNERTAVGLAPLGEGRPVPLPSAPLFLLTSFVAFELTSAEADQRTRFVLNLAAEGLPVEERDAAIVRDVIRNRDGFLRCVLLLLAGAGDGEGSVFGEEGGVWKRFQRREAGEEELPVFEHLVRTFCRDVDRLAAVRGVFTGNKTLPLDLRVRRICSICSGGREVMLPTVRRRIFLPSRHASRMRMVGREPRLGIVSTYMET